MKRIFLAATVAILTSAAMADTYTFSSSGTSLGGQAVAVTGTVTLPDVTPIAPTPTPTPTPTPSAASWVYHNGTFLWAGDWSFTGTPNYKDTAGVPTSGSADIAFTVTGQWGGWQPYVNGACNAGSSACFDTTAYRYIVFQLKPTITNQTWTVMFHSAGDTNDGIPVAVASYGPSGGPVVGQWGTYKIPLSVFGLTDTTILKFFIQDQTGRSSNLWYADDVGFE